MTNEEIVGQIWENPEQKSELTYELYVKNRPLIVKTVKPFVRNDNFEDLMHEAYFGMIDAVDHYNSSVGVKFISYALFWVKRSIYHYLQENEPIRLPINVWQKVGAYKRYIAGYYTSHGHYPTEEECSQALDLSHKDLEYIIIQSQPVASLNSEKETEDGSLSMIDTIPSGENMEEDTIEQIYSDYMESEIWKICESGLSTDREKYLFDAKYRKNMSNVEIAKEMGISQARAGQLSASLLRKLRCGKIKHELRRRLYIDDCRTYNNGLSSYKQHNFTSSVERRVLSHEIILEQMKSKYGDLIEECSF